MGADSFASFRRWHRAAEIPFVAPLIVASRPSGSRWSPDHYNTTLPAGLTLMPAPEPNRVASEIPLHRYILRNPDGDLAPFYLLPGLHIDISASQIREQIREQIRAHTRISPQSPSASAARTPESSLLPAPVLKYIRAHNLYR